MRIFSNQKSVNSQRKPEYGFKGRNQKGILKTHVHGEEGSREQYVCQLSQEHIGTRGWWSGGRKSNLLIPITESINSRQEERSTRWWELMRCSPFKPLLLNITSKKKTEYSFKSKQEILWRVCFWSVFAFREKDGKGEHCLSRLWWTKWRAGSEHRV
jgi:hypothetical protein